MKKTTKTLLSLLLVLVMALQFGAVAPLAHAVNDDAPIALSVKGPVDDKGKLDPDGDPGDVTDAVTLSALVTLSTAGELKSGGLTLTPPEGYAVTTLYLAPSAGDYQRVLLDSAALTDYPDDGAAITIDKTLIIDEVFNGATDACTLFVELSPCTYVAAKASTCSAQGNDPYVLVGDDLDELYEINLVTEIPKLPLDGSKHNATLTHHEAAAATCGADGNEEYWECPDCHQLFSDANGATKIDAVPTIGKLPHNAELEHHEEVPATCAAAGTGEYWECPDCHQLFSDAAGTAEIDAIPALPKLDACALPLNHHEVVPATCTTDGNEEYWECPICHQLYSNEGGTAKINAIPTTPALTHDWGTVSYTWAPDYSKCTASRTCKRDNCGTTESETVDTVAAYTATCTADGTVTYTATFTNTAFTAQTTPAVTQAALGHDWDEIQYVWADDNSTVTATRTCKRDATHVETETVKATGAVTKAATAEADGERTFTSEAFQNTAFAVQTKKVAIPKADTPAVIAAGTETKWSPDDKDGMSFHLDATFNEENVKGIQVFVDGKAVPAQYIKITPGSVVVTVDPAYLATLTPGTHNITISFPSGHDVSTSVTIDTPNSLAFAIDPAGCTKVYDGASFDLNALKSYITLVNLPAGHTAEVEISYEGGVPDFYTVGTVTVTLHLKAVKDGSGADVTASFTCSDKTGVPLTITPRKITVETRDDSKVYDGKAWTYTHMSNPQPIMTYTDPKLGEYVHSGNTYVQTISIKYTSSPKNMGTYDNKAELIIREKVKGSSETGTDVTANYEITYKYGKIKITDSKGNVPKNSYATGDENNIWLWIGLMAATVVLVVVILVFTRKGKKRNDVTNP